MYTRDEMNQKTQKQHEPQCCENQKEKKSSIYQNHSLIHPFQLIDNAHIFFNKTLKKRQFESSQFFPPFPLW